MAEVVTTAPDAPSRRGIAPGSEAEQQLLTALVERIRSKCSPKQVYLFGSRAHEGARIRSDIDLLVIVPEEQATTACWASLLDATAHGPVGVDVALSTPDELAWRSLVPGFVEYDAIQRGRLLCG